MSFLSRAWRNGVILSFVTRSESGGRVGERHRHLIILRWEVQRGIVVEDGERIGGRGQEFIGGKQGRGVDGGGR